MSNERTRLALKWVLIAVCTVSITALGAFVLLMTYPAKQYRAADELQARGFEIHYERQGFTGRQYPYVVIGEKLNITEDDCRLIGQLPHLQELLFQRCDLSGLNLDDIGNCRKLRIFHCNDVTQFPVDEIRKLTDCPIHAFGFTNAHWNDYNLEEFAKWTKLEKLYLGGNAGITDAGLGHLEKIVSLRELQLQETSVTKDGIKEFQRKRPDVKVYFE
ncbi:MAG: protein phosphatase 1 regulatory subunit 42 [Planctomycetaceae bacterium]|nr:protein phosphatase 1 regulatory subunit 42 [Planctomycetaceae bacterium]